MSKYNAIGLMSGSSMDGLDIAYCEFEFKDNKWSYKILYAETYQYDEEWYLTLKHLAKADALKIQKIHFSYGELLARFVNNFINKYKIKVNLIASHGHTIFHEPASNFSYQIGDGQTIAYHTGVKTICDFRSKDILFGGQGAPLVPIGDKLLFSDFDFCLNIGGITNISFNENSKRIAFDISGANQILNHLSNQFGKPYDENGRIAQLGKMNKQLFDTLNDDEYFLMKNPKSLSNHYVEKHFIKLVDEFNCSIEDKLFTVCKHIAYQINNSVKKHESGDLLITGGGAYNTFLINAIKRETHHHIVIPDSSLIEFKEALIFAFMGVLRSLGEINCLASVTGAKKDSSCGVIHDI